LVISADVSNGTQDPGNDDGLFPYADFALTLSEGLDPWGMRYRYVPNSTVINFGVSSTNPSGSTVALRLYSLGPNRTDDGATGDDIVLTVTVAELRGQMNAALLP
jgi:hypothetical protein